MRPFAQFLNSGEHERLIASIERERELRHRLSELKRYRSLGLTTQEEIIHYEQHVAFQRQQIKQGKMVRISYFIMINHICMLSLTLLILLLLLGAFSWFVHE